MSLKRIVRLVINPAAHEERMNLINEAGALVDTAREARHRGDMATWQRSMSAADRLLDATRPQD